MAPRNYWTDGLTWACNAGIFVFGIVLALLGALLPVLFEQVHLDPAQAGSLFLFLNFGALVATLTLGLLFDRFGFKAILALSSLVAAASFFGMGHAGTYAALAACSFVLGIGGGGLNAGTNALIADLYPEAPGVALNRLGIFFGIGTFFIPFVVGIFLERASLEAILTGTAVLGLVPGLLFLVFSFPAGKHAAGFPFHEAAGLVRHPLVLLLGILLFFQSGNEITTSGWMTTFLVDRLSLSAAGASLYLSGFWAAVVLGRLLASWLLGRLSEPALVQWSGLAASLGLLLFILFPHPIFSAVLCSVVGLAMAGIFPSVLAQASARFPAFSGTVIGTLMGIALIGGMLLPWLAGLLVERTDTGAALILPVAGFACVSLLQTAAKKR